MCLVGAVGRGQIFQLIHDAPGLGFNPAVMQSRNVGFGCPFSDRSAASFHTAFGHSQVSFTITEKTTTAIVGPSGAGKTTMCNLIARFWDVNSGKITIGGTDVRDFKLDSLMKNISMVFQSVYLFADTIENNIKFGCPDAEKIYERHCFFTEQLIAAGVDPRTAEADACRIEHIISDESFDRLKEAAEQE